MDRDGYLYLPGFLDREDVREVRLRICERLAEEGLLDPNALLEDAVAAPGADVAFRPDIVSGGAPRWRRPSTAPTLWRSTPPSSAARRRT